MSWLISAPTSKSQNKKKINSKRFLLFFLASPYQNILNQIEKIQEDIFERRVLHTQQAFLVTNYGRWLEDVKILMKKKTSHQTNPFFIYYQSMKNKTSKKRPVYSISICFFLRAYFLFKTDKNYNTIEKKNSKTLNRRKESTKSHQTTSFEIVFGIYHCLCVFIQCNRSFSQMLGFFFVSPSSRTCENINSSLLHLWFCKLILQRKLFFTFVSQILFFYFNIFPSNVFDLLLFLLHNNFLTF